MKDHFTLGQYVDLARGNQTALAKKLKCPSQLIWAWARGTRRVPAEKCLLLEEATEGMVLCETLRPDVPWRVIAARFAAAVNCTGTGGDGMCA